MPTLPETLLNWYDKHLRSFPWRAAPGHQPNPYYVWLSEIMLQQTTTMTVRDYFLKFITKWPTIQDLGKADLDDILVMWQGLGYYARARNLYKCAQVICQKGGGFPNSYDALSELPGVGPYTAAAIAAIAFDQPVGPVDGNIIRVLSRVYAINTPMPSGKAIIQTHIDKLVPKNRPGDFAQALMDLGATVCTPKKPNCTECPWSSDCKAFLRGVAENFPVKDPKRTKPTKHAYAFVIRNQKGQIYLRKRPEKGLLANMMEVPSSDSIESETTLKEVLPSLPLSTTSHAEEAHQVKHTFTHFHLKLKVVQAISSEESPNWHDQDKLSELALPTLMKKVLNVGLPIA